MKLILKSISGIFILVLMIISCSKESISPPVDDVNPPMEDSTEVMKREQEAASNYVIAQSLVNEILTIPLDLVTRFPYFLGVTGSTTPAQTRSCPNVQVIFGANNIDTLIMDFGTGCTTSGGSMVAGRILLISSGSLNTNANQFIQFDTVTINGYQVVHNYGVGSSGLKFNNITPNLNPPNYLFEGKAPFLTSFVTTGLDGSVTTIVPQYSPVNFMQLTIVDNDPPLTLDYADFEDANYQAYLSPMQMTTIRPGGQLDIYQVSQIVGTDDALMYHPNCRWLNEGQLRFQGTITQLLNFGWDYDAMGNPVVGTDCDGIAKISDLNGNNCTFVQCP